MKDISNIPSNEVTMSSLELVEMINASRKEGEAELRHDSFMTKVPKVLGETAAPKFIGVGYFSNGTGGKVERKIYNFPKREACLMAMSYSYELQAKVFDRMSELEASKQSRSMTALEVIQVQTQILIDQEKRITANEEAIKKITAKQVAFEEGLSYFTIVGYAAYKGFTVDLSMAKSLGKKASKLSASKGVPVDRTKDPRFGMVNSYHERILDEVVNKEMNDETLDLTEETS